MCVSITNLLPSLYGYQEEITGFILVDKLCEYVPMKKKVQKKDCMLRYVILGRKISHNVANRLQQNLAEYLK